MYIRHTLIEWVQFLRSRPQTTSHVVLVDQEAIKDRVGVRAEMEQGSYGTGLTKRQLTCEKDRARAKMEQEQSKRDRARKRRWKQRDIASEESKAKEESPTDTRTTLCSCSETLHTTTLPSSLRYLVPSTSHLHATRGYNGNLLAYFWIFFCTRHTLHMRIPSNSVGRCCKEAIKSTVDTWDVL